MTTVLFLGALKGRQDSAMPQSLAKNLVHLVFSTKNRERVLTEPVREPLCLYAAAVLRDLDSHVLAINAWHNHVHILFSLSKNHSLARIVMEVKRGTSKWIKTQGAGFANFHWQSGYGAFSIGQSGVDEVKSYIANQAKHHQVKSFEEEFRSFLKRYQVEFDERYMWD
jgi:putative transposase